MNSDQLTFDFMGQAKTAVQGTVDPVVQFPCKFGHSVLSVRGNSNIFWDGVNEDSPGNGGYQVICCFCENATEWYRKERDAINAWNELNAGV